MSTVFLQPRSLGTGSGSAGPFPCAVQALQENATVGANQRCFTWETLRIDDGYILTVEDGGIFSTFDLP